MTQDRKGTAHEHDDLSVQGFGLGLDDVGDDPSEFFTQPAARPPAHASANASAHAAPVAAPPSRAHVHQPEPDLPDIDDPFGGPGGFDPAPVRQAAAPRDARDPGDWGSMTAIGGASSRGGGFGDAAEQEGDPAAEFSGFETAQGVASLGPRTEGSLGYRHEPEPEHPPKGSYRGDDAGFDEVVGNFGDEEDHVEVPKGSLYRETLDDDQEEVDEGDQSLSLADDADEHEEDAQDEESEAGPSIVDRLKRFAIPVAAAAAIGGAGYVGWGFVSPMLGLGGDAAPVQMAGPPIVPKQPNASLPSFPPAAGAQQRPALPGTAGALPSMPGQQAVTVAPNYLPQAQQPQQQFAQQQPRQVGLPPVQGSPSAPQPYQGQALPSASPLPQTQPYAAAQPVQQVQLPPAGAGASNLSPGGLPGVGDAVRDTPKLGGGLNARTGATGDLEARLASIAADLSAMRSRQDETARTARSDMDEMRGRLGDLERKVGDGKRVQTAKPSPAPVEEVEAKPRRAERPARSIRRAEARAAYQQEASASAEDGLPPLKPKVVQGFNLRGVSRGVASVEGRGGVVEVGVGQNIPGVGEVKAIRRYGNDWVVVVGKGVIVQQ